MIRIYTYAKCSTCQKALKFLGFDEATWKRLLS